jgi:L-arabinose 1-dehydrogenase [NAD(P)+]
MTRIALTGAAGNVGRELLDVFGDQHELVAFTHSEHDDVDSELLDVTDADEVTEKLDGFDVVIHLAGASSPDADWEMVMEMNVQGTKHIYDAADENGIERVVYASSNHAVGRYNDANGDPETTKSGYARTVDGDAATRPDSYYGVSKAACEDLGKFYADVRGIEVVNLRIGWYMTEDDLRETVDDADPGTERFARATWLSPRDCRDIHRKAATAELPENPVTVNAVSRNGDRFYSITETMQTLGYEPRDDAAEVLED